MARHVMSGVARAPIRVLHVTPAFFPATYWGGPIFSTYALCNGLATLGIELQVLTTDTAGPRLGDRLTVSESQRTEAGYRVYYCRKRLGVSFAPTMFRRLFQLVRWADVIHLTAVYSAPTLPVLLICRIFRKPLVWSPRGALQTWSGSRNRAVKSVWTVLCRAAICASKAMLHVTSVDEERDSRAEFPRVATVLIPNGVEVPSILPSRQWRPEGVLRVVFLGRLDPKKGIENLIHGVTQVTGVDLDVAIYGIGVPEYERSLKDLVGHLSLGRKISFKGHVEHEAKSEVFMHADIVVVPSFTENFALVVAEALAHAVPVIASKGTPWQDIEKHGCGLWVGNSPEAIADAIENMSGRDLAAMGRRGREWMLRDFSWAGVAESMKATYATFVPQ